MQKFKITGEKKGDELFLKAEGAFNCSSFFDVLNILEKHQYKAGIKKIHLDDKGLTKINEGALGMLENIMPRKLRKNFFSSTGKLRLYIDAH